MSDQDAAQLQSDLNALWNWTQGSLFKFNLSKCHRLTLTKKSKRSLRSYTTDGDKLVTRIDIERSLGVSVDYRLYFKERF